MKTLLLSLAALLPIGSALAQTTTAATDEVAIRQVVKRMSADWQSHRFANIVAYTTPDVSWVNIVGMWWRGRPQVQQAHQQIFDAMFTGVAFTPGKTVVRTVAPGVAVVNLYCHVGAFYPPDGVNRGTNKEAEADNLLTLVLVKRQGRWLLTAGQNTVVRASAQPNNPVGKTSPPEPFDPAKLADLH